MHASRVLHDSYRRRHGRSLTAAHSLQIDLDYERSGLGKGQDVGFRAIEQVHLNPDALASAFLPISSKYERPSVSKLPRVVVTDLIREPLVIGFGVQPARPDPTAEPARFSGHFLDAVEVVSVSSMIGRQR